MDGGIHQEFRQCLDESAEELGNQFVASIPSTPVEPLERVSSDADPVEGEDSEPSDRASPDPGTGAVRTTSRKRS